MSDDAYTVAEVTFLSSIDEREAIACDEGLSSPLGRLTQTGLAHGSSGERPMPVLPRWHEVRRVREQLFRERRSARDERDREIVRLRLEGWTADEIAERMEVTDRTIRRRFRAVNEQIVLRLGGTPVDAAADDATERVERLLERYRRAQHAP